MPSTQHRPSPRRSLLIGLSFLPVALAGCVKQVTQGSETTFTYELWLPALLLVGGIVAAPAGWALKRHSARLGWVLVILGPILALLVAPSIYSDQVVVNDDFFRIHTGLWAASNDETIRFADLQSVQVTEETKITRRGKRTSTYLLCNLKGGGQKKIGLSGNLTGSAVVPIVAGIAKHGVPLIE